MTWAAPIARGLVGSYPEPGSGCEISRARSFCLGGFGGGGGLRVKCCAGMSVVQSSWHAVACAKGSGSEYDFSLAELKETPACLASCTYSLEAGNAQVQSQRGSGAPGQYLERSVTVTAEVSKVILGTLCLDRGSQKLENRKSIRAQS